MRMMTFRLSDWICSTNSGLSFSNSISARFCNSSSLVSGRIIVQQSRSLKKLFNSRLMRFFYSTASLKPFWLLRAFSRYSLLVMGSCSESSNYKVKSRTTHIKLGKYYANSSGSVSSLLLPDLI